ncbi:MAG: lysophospholipid acyltransferase family protein [Gammaproteobacteria bacterium]|nr:MAG: lysophospholipid acyltransferase family protein [Gammaproteobacteria bacterium]
MVLLRSILFQIYFFASVAVFALLVALCAPFPYRVRFAISRTWGRSMLWAGRLLCGLRWSLEGAANMPDEPCVVMVKHTTVFETYAQLAFFPAHTFVLKRELLWIPLFGWGLAALRPIAIDRRSGHTAVTQVIEQGRERLAAGIWITVFPEGTRMPPGQTRRYGISGAALAKAAGVKIVPVAHNAGDLWPRRGLRKRPGLIRYCIGPPIDTSSRPPKETNLIVQGWIEAQMADISDAYRDASAHSPDAT